MPAPTPTPTPKNLPLSHSHPHRCRLRRPRLAAWPRRSGCSRSRPAAAASSRPSYEANARTSWRTWSMRGCCVRRGRGGCVYVREQSDCQAAILRAYTAWVGGWRIVLVVRDGGWAARVW
eukprot:scaffold28390_cov109-Isochrysis_galbana.AAC.8